MVDAKALLTIVRQLDAPVILHAARLCEGHGILDPQVFVNIGLPSEVVEQLTIVHRSDYRSSKTTLYRRGQPVDELKGPKLPGTELPGAELPGIKLPGVDGLDMLTFLAGALGIEYGYCFGRGSQVREIRRALDAHFAGVTQSKS